MMGRWWLLGALAALVVSGLTSAGRVQAQQEELSLAWVPADAPGLFAVMGVLPDRLQALPGVAQLQKELTKQADQNELPIHPAEVRQVIVVGVFDLQPRRRSPEAITGGYILHLKTPLAEEKWQAWVQTGTVRRWKQRSYYTLTDLAAVARVDNGRTVIVTGGLRAEPLIRLMLEAGPQGAQQAAWARQMRTLRLGQGENAPRFSQLALAAYLSPQAIEKTLPEELLRQAKREPLVASLLLLIRKPQAIHFGLDIKQGELKLAYVSSCRPGEEQTAEQLANILRGLVATGQLVLGSLEQSAAREEQKRVVRMFRALLGKVQVEQKKTDVVASLALNKQEVQIVATALTSAVVGARQAARRAQSQNNLRQLALAMHIFHDLHRRLPPAAARRWNGKKLKYPVSWRVLVLPYLDHKELYDQYRFDQPWNSPHNLKLLGKMPDVFRHPKDDPKSTHTSYFVLVGPGTMFEPKGDGISFKQVPDGVAYTLMIVEAKRKVPWTKPEDIPFDPAKPLPKLGGWSPRGFNAAFCDASVRLLPKDLPAETLRWLIQRNDGKFVKLP